MSRLLEAEAFVAVLEEGSFTAAAQRLGLAKSYVSRLVSALEDRLGAQLLHRTTRRLVVTDAGQTFYEHALRAVEGLDRAEEAVTALQGTPRGLLRVGAPVSYGLRAVAPALATYAERYREVTLECSYEDRFVDIVGEGLDLVVRIRRDLPDSTLVARALRSSATRTCASPAYLGARGRPTRPQDLRAHDCLLYSLQVGGHAWRFGDETVRVDGRVRANSGDALVEAAVRGLGVVRSPDFMIDEHIATGALVPVLEEYEESTTIWCVSPPGRHRSPAVRAAVELLVEACGQAS